MKLYYTISISIYIERDAAQKKETTTMAVANAEQFCLCIYRYIVIYTQHSQRSNTQVIMTSIVSTNEYHRAHIHQKFVYDH